MGIQGIPGDTFGVFVPKCPILLTASLDPTTEKALIDQLMVLAQDKTAIIISHRLFVTPMVDRIIVLEHGRLVEEGTHQQLMELDGVYVKMFNTQVGMYWPTAP